MIVMNKAFYYTSLLLFTGFSVFSCQKSQKKPAESLPADSGKLGYTIQKLDTATLKNPWGMVWLPDGRLLITEKAGEILVFKNDKFTGQKLEGVPAVFNKGQGGLFDIVIHPD